MKIKDLIEKLSKYDPETLVMVEGYEAGVDYPGEPYETPIRLNQNDEWFYGKHEVHHVTDDNQPDTTAVIIPR